MTILTPKRTGLATVIAMARVICRVAGKWSHRIRPLLDTPERIAYDALIAACQEFSNTMPIPGVDDDPGTTT